MRLSKILLDSLVRSSLMWDIDGTRSQMTLSETRIGTDNKAPGTPQSQVQKINETKITTGLSVKRRPGNNGVMKLAKAITIRAPWDTNRHPHEQTELDRDQRHP